VTFSNKLHIRVAPWLFIVALLIADGCSTGDTESSSSNSAAVSASPVVRADTTRSGRIVGDEIWRGTITVTGDIIIGAGTSLTIEPGTTVKFTARADDQRHGPCDPDPNTAPGDPVMIQCELSGIEVNNGTLRAEGTADHPIVFTSSSDRPAAGDWSSIHFQQTGSKLTLRHTVIEYACWGVPIAARATNQDIVLADNIIRHVATCGICITYETGRTVTINISGNDISDCGHEAIDTTPNAELVIAGNIFRENVNGIVIHSNFSEIRNNRFVRNRRALSVHDEAGVFSATKPPRLSGNAYEGNDVDLECEGFQCPYLTTQ
jgi:hypothetical protein